MNRQRPVVTLFTVVLLAGVAAGREETKQWIIPLKYAPAPATADALTEFAKRKKLSVQVTADEPTNQVVMVGDEASFMVVEAEALKFDTDVSSVETDLLLLSVPTELAERVVGKAGGRALSVREARILMAAACEARERGEAELLSRQSFDLSDGQAGDFELKGSPLKLSGRLTPYLGIPAEGAKLKVEFSMPGTTDGGKSEAVEVPLDHVEYDGIAVFRGPTVSTGGGERKQVLAVVVVKRNDQVER